VSTDGAGWPFWIALAFALTSKLNGIVCSGDPGATVVKLAIQLPADGNVACVTRIPTAFSIYQMNWPFSALTASPLGPVNEISTVRFGFAIGAPEASWNENRTRFSPTINSEEIITG